MTNLTARPDAGPSRRSQPAPRITTAKTPTLPAAASSASILGCSRQRDRDIRGRRLPKADAPTTAMEVITADHVAAWLGEREENHPAHTPAPVRTRTNATSDRRTLSLSPVH